MPGWVVGEGRYVYGLEEWYRTYDVPTGAYLELARGERLGTVVIRRRSRRPRREWVWVASPVDGRLIFEMRKRLIACEHDELIVVAGEAPEVMDTVWAHTHEQRLSLSQLIADMFPELAKLSPQGAVHATTLCNAVNFAKRIPPGPLLAELVTSGVHAPVGDNYWVLYTGPGGVGSADE
jgi:hypothetical protein